MNIGGAGKTVLYVVLLSTLLCYAEENQTVATILRLFVLSYCLYKVVLIILFLASKLIVVVRNEINLRRWKNDPSREDIHIDKGYSGVSNTDEYITAFREISSTFQKADEDRRSGNKVGYLCEVHKLANHFIISRLSIKVASFSYEHKEQLCGTIAAFQHCGDRYPEVSAYVIECIRRFDKH